jgi:hypothetical protein
MGTQGRAYPQVWMAVGAQGRDILLQFLVEAVTLSMIGGVLGIAVGLIGSHAISYFAEWRTLVAPETIMLAFGFAAAVGVFFGFYPARKTRLSPWRVPPPIPVRAVVGRQTVGRADSRLRMDPTIGPCPLALAAHPG